MITNIINLMKGGMKTDIKKEELIKKYLIEDIRTGDNQKDNADFSWNGKRSEGMIEFSIGNQRSLFNEFNKVKDKVNTIVEIGVSRIEGAGRHDYKDSSTSIFLNNKKKETKYLGIDIKDKTYLESYTDNVFTLKSPSENYKVILEKLQEIDIKKIDFLFVDGWHSINQVIDELWFIEFMESGGIIGYHDTNFHPGPSRIINKFKPELFDYKRYCIDEMDWGIGFVYIK